MSKLGFGLSLNNRALVYLPGYSIADLISLAEKAEELSFESLWVGDSLIDSPRFEPLTLLGAVASKTKKVKIGGSIIQPHFRNPIMLALSWATLDRISLGRAILTLGIGGGTPKGVAKEAELVGVDVTKRGKALEETVEILRTLWRGDTLQYDGAVYKMHDVKLGFRPTQNPPPIWIASGVYVPKDNVKQISGTPGFTKKSHGGYSGSFNRVGRLADGWITIMADPAEFKNSSELISNLAVDNKRKPSNIIRAIECWFNVNSERDIARREVAEMIESYFGNPVDDQTIDRWSIYGTPDECIKRIEKYKEAGVQVMKLIMGSKDQISMLQKTSNEVLQSF
ncbi:MAG: LLM class flavin-dependent oxidoreductase [Thaumarchaeota archaeon]|nr:LLM class flavin-dependent oxidoreductase [Nitrososphaerota archaeon]